MDVVKGTQLKGMISTQDACPFMCINMNRIIGHRSRAILGVAPTLLALAFVLQMLSGLRAARGDYREAKRTPPSGRVTFLCPLAF